MMMMVKKKLMFLKCVVKISAQGLIRLYKTAKVLKPQTNLKIYQIQLHKEFDRTVVNKTARGC